MVLNHFECRGTSYPHSEDNDNLVISNLSQGIHQVNIDPNVYKAKGHKMVALNGHFAIDEHISETPSSKREQMPLLGQK